MLEPKGWHRCPVCGPIEDVDTIMELTAEHLVGRTSRRRRSRTARYALYVAPRRHEATLLQLQEAGIEVERFEH